MQPARIVFNSQKSFTSHSFFPWCCCGCVWALITQGKTVELLKETQESVCVCWVGLGLLPFNSPGLPGSLQFLNVDMIAQTPSMKQLVITFIYGKKEFSSLVKILIKYFFIPFFGITCRNKANFPLHLGSISHFPLFLTSE